MHKSDTVLVVYGKGIDPLFEESPMFEIIISWKYNNYLIRYPFVDTDRHAITGTLKKLIMEELPNGSYEVSPQVTELLNESTSGEPTIGNHGNY